MSFTTKEARFCAMESCQAPIMNGRPKFCSEECRRKSSAQRWTDLEREWSHNSPNSPIPDEWSECVRLHKAGLGIKALEKVTGESRGTIRRRLLEFGCYRPSGVWKPKLNEKGISERRLFKLRELKKRVRNSEVRPMLAAVLRRLRKGCALQTICREMLIDLGPITYELTKRTSYKLIMLKRNHGRYAKKDILKGVRSKLFDKEALFQKHIESILSKSSFSFKGQHKIGGSKPDIIVDNRYLLELKVESKRKAIYTVIGQLLHTGRVLRESGIQTESVLLLPSDCSIQPSLESTLKEYRIVVLNELNLMHFLCQQDPPH